MPDGLPSPPPHSMALGSEAVLRRLPGIDVLRGIAAGLVFLFHFVGLFDSNGRLTQSWGKLVVIPTFFGSIGTNLLLLLCGFMIARSLVKPQFHYRSFLQDRFFRIYLPYFLVIASALLFWQAFPSFAKLSPHSIDLNYVFTQFVLVPGLFPNRPVLTVSWTLSLIFSAYCLFPLLAILYRKLLRQTLSSLLPLWLFLLLTCLASALLRPDIPVRFCYIPLGCAVAEWFFTASPNLLPLRRIPLLLLTAMLALSFRFWLIEYRSLLNLPHSEYTFLFWSCGATATTIGTSLAILTSPGQIRTWFRLPLRGLLFLGRRGYSFYLLHGPITKISAFCLGSFCTGAASALALALFCFTSSLLAAHFMYSLIEIRLIGYLRAWLPSTRPALLSQRTA